MDGGVCRLKAKEPNHISNGKHSEIRLSLVSFLFESKILPSFCRTNVAFAMLFDQSGRWRCAHTMAMVGSQ